MKSDDLLKWFDQVKASQPRGQVVSSLGMHQEGVKWVADAASAIAAAFPQGHELRRQWEALSQLTDTKTTRGPLERQRWEGYVGIFASAREQLHDGRLGSLIDGVRAETEDDFLDQAEWLRRENALPAAAVVAGGALEIHLRQLCAKNKLVIQGHGTIDKYNVAIAEARNQGLVIYEKSDGSSITSWGQIRNDAAHKPDQFHATSDQVKLMIDGIRNFISRVR